MRILSLLLLVALLSCEKKPVTIIAPWVPYDESQEIAANAEHESSRMRYKRIQSVVLDKNDIWTVVQPQIEDFSEEDYTSLKPLIYEKSIVAIQKSIREKKLTYEQLVKWYLYRIVKFENDSNKTLHTVLAINSEAVAMARERDASVGDGNHLMFGMPVLLKDNINAEGMKTTAGAHALLNNETSDAFIVERLKEKGAIILGKVNLSEWANFICSGCPNGYSAVGGQTLNPYGRMIFDTGGSSAGSGTSMAANYAVAAIGTETSGSILSPSSSNSIVGLKPTVGLLSRSGIVPISSTLDTPGPMTRNVLDNAILLSALLGSDPDDPMSDATTEMSLDLEEIETGSLQGVRFGVMKAFLEDSVYRNAVGLLENSGAEMVEIEPENARLPGFLNLLNGDMKNDLPVYIDAYGGENLPVRTVKDVVGYNLQDTVQRLAYNQRLFEGIVADSTSADSLVAIKRNLREIGMNYFQMPMNEYQLDVILSVNNWSAGYAAVAQFPCLTVPMGYTSEGRPMGLTLIAQPFEEKKLLKLGYAVEKTLQARKAPTEYE